MRVQERKPAVKLRVTNLFCEYKMSYIQNWHYKITQHYNINCINSSDGESILNIPLKVIIELQWSTLYLAATYRNISIDSNDTTNTDVIVIRKGSV
jgi:hypothetical protein